MITGIKKADKETVISFTEADSEIGICTYNTDLKNRLSDYASRHPDLCRQTDDDGFGGLRFSIDRKRFGFRLTEPYSTERKEKARVAAKRLNCGKS